MKSFKKFLLVITLSSISISLFGGFDELKPKLEKKFGKIIAKINKIDDSVFSNTDIHGKTLYQKAAEKFGEGSKEYRALTAINDLLTECRNLLSFRYTDRKTLSEFSEKIKSLGTSFGQEGLYKEFKDRLDNLVWVITVGQNLRGLVEAGESLWRILADNYLKVMFGRFGIENLLNHIKRELEKEPVPRRMPPPIPVKKKIIEMEVEPSPRRVIEMEVEPSPRRMPPPIPVRKRIIEM